MARKNGEVLSVYRQKCGCIDPDCGCEPQEIEIVRMGSVYSVTFQGSAVAVTPSAESAKAVVRVEYPEAG